MNIGIVKENSELVALMEQNIENGYMPEESQECIDALFEELKEAKKVLAEHGVIAV